MTGYELHIVVLAGGQSKRTGTGRPKGLLGLCGHPVLDWVLTAADGVSAASRTLVVGAHAEPIEAWLATSGHDWAIARQPEPLGTGDAVSCALPLLPAEGRVLILCGDTPLLTVETLQDLAGAQEGAMLAADLDNPTGYGRIIRGEDGTLEGIVEEADASDEQKGITQVNAGVYCLDLARLRSALKEVRADNSQGEFYLTDAAIRVLQQTEGSVLLLPDGDEILGVNTLTDLAWVKSLMMEQIVLEHLANGVQIVDPASCYIEHGVSIGPGTVVQPFSVIEKGAVVGAGCQVGPFAHLCTGAVLEDGASVGNFVEIKRSVLGAGAKAKHLAYLGDAQVGPEANIGAGTITANYDGVSKHTTVIGQGASIGSGSILVAPVTIGDRAVTGAGAVVPSGHNVADGETVVGVPARPLEDQANKEEC